MDANQTPLEREYPHFEEIYNLVTGKDGRVMTDPTPLEQARESVEEQISRVRLMASGDPTWDLSGNDLLALQTVLSLALAAPTPEPAGLSAEVADMIAWMSEARDSHRQWAEHLEAHAASGVSCAECDSKPYKLSSDGEREWERRYALVLRALSAAPPPDDLTPALRAWLAAHDAIAAVQHQQGTGQAGIVEAQATLRTAEEALLAIARRPNG